MKVIKSYLLLAGLVCLAFVLLSACAPVTTASPMPISPIVTAEDSISGTVVDTDGEPVPGATVRIQATTNVAQTDANGKFTLNDLDTGIPVTVSAWKQDYYCAKTESVTPPASEVSLTLRLYQTNDNPAYEWIPPTGENSCYSCKPGVTQVWLDNDAHGKSATNIRFLTMYNGADVDGNQSPPTRYVFNRDYGSIPLRPDLTQPYYGPGYKLDFPETAGNCAACHIPGSAIEDPYGIDPNTVTGVNTFGVHCDFCHKVADIKLNPETSLPYPNMPGVLSMDIRRPFPEDKDRYQLFFGSFDDDNVPMEDTYLPLIKESRWCATCHYGIFWNTVVYNSFGEWLASPYSDPSTGKTCQQCHMPAPTVLNGRPLTNVAPDLGGVERDPLTIPAHTFPGASNVELLQNSVTMTVNTRREDQNLIVEVSITNDKTGHHVPTDSPLRQLILLVDTKDGQGQALSLLKGETIPAWGGIGDPKRGYYAGLPGKGFARILRELWTEIEPTGSYWNPTRIISDNRIGAFETNTSTYIFALPEGGNVSVKITLLFRRAFKELMDQKGWDVPDIVMEEEEMVVP
ncbi:MAG: carboxypeptidase-like regulatory domain-containing protein [Chloroflexi bacterium]|nr:carboxypeptidase-like regulatory domain-containing protein [Chloroflexota bacterium]